MVCEPKKQRGLGVSDLRAVNASLLAKLRWRFLSSKLELCKEVLLVCCGQIIVGNVVLDVEGQIHNSSVWWKDAREKRPFFRETDLSVLGLSFRF